MKIRPKKSFLALPKIVCNQGVVWDVVWDASGQDTHTRGGERDRRREEQSAAAKLALPSDGERGVVLVRRGGRCSGSRGRRNSRSRVGSSGRAEWKREEKRWKIKTYKSAAAAAAVEWGGMGRSGAACSSWFGRSSSSSSDCSRLGMEWDAEY